MVRLGLVLDLELIIFQFCHPDEWRQSSRLQTCSMSVIATSCVWLPCQQVASGDGMMSVKLKATLKRIAENLVVSVSDGPSPAILSGSSTIDPSLEERRDAIPRPHISPAVDLNRPDTLYGLVERVVASESL